MKKLMSGALLAGLVGTWLLFAATAMAATANLSRSYASDGPIEPGSIVSLASLQSKTVTLANTTNSDKIIGVAVGDTDAVIAVNPTAGKIQVTTSGIADVLVSDLNGDIEQGDKVAVSPFNGIGMKSGSGERIIGLAQSAFTSDSDPLSTRQVTDKDGNSRELRLGKIQINVIIGNDDDTGSQNLSGLQRFVKSLTGRVVPTIRIVISMIIAIVTIVTLIIIIYSAIYGSIVSIGRNPLARGSILQALRQVVWIAAMALLAGLGFIFLLLR
jgi:hypothetical protein